MPRDFADRHNTLRCLYQRLKAHPSPTHPTALTSSIGGSYPCCARIPPGPPPTFCTHNPNPSPTPPNPQKNPPHPPTPPPHTHPTPPPPTPPTHQPIPTPHATTHPPRH